MALKLYTYTPSYRAWKILVAAAYNDVKIDVVSDFKMGKDNKSPEFLLRNPLGKVPTLDTPQGPIFESNAIARYVARIRADTDLYGSSFYESAQVDQWMDVSANEFEPACAIIRGFIPNVAEEHMNEARNDIDKILGVFDKHLLTRTYLVGNKITLADIAVCSALAAVADKVLDANKFVNLNRWYLTLRNQPNFVKVLGAPEASPATESKGQKQQKAKEEKPQKEKPAKEEKAKEDKPKKDKKKKAEEEEDDGAEAHEDPKKANPLDALPPSKMVLDAVKRLFFEKRPNFDQFFKEFWGFFDDQGYSIYFLDYKYNDDNKVYFMTCNLTAGYSQRLEELRKYAFGVLNVTGTDEDTGPFNVNGCFICRGTGVPAELSECPDTEYYNITPCDIKDKAQRKKVEDAFYGNTYQGQNVLDRKYFK